MLPNAWDAGSARILEPVGFSAIATTTAGIAWSCGLADAEALDPDGMRERVGQIVAAVKLGFLDGASAYGDIQRRFGS